LQISFFADHPQLYHLGNGHAGRNNRYIDDAVTSVAEVDLRYKKNYLFDAAKSRAALASHIDAAQADDRVKAVGMSSEFLCFTLGNEIDVVDKAKRLKQLFGEDTCIVFVFREQISLLTSLYTELVKGGYPGTAKKFFEYTYIYQDRNWCIDFCFDRILETYIDLLGEQNVCAIPFELLKEDETTFLSLICDKIGISPTNKAMRVLNKRGSSLGMLELTRRFNEKYQHEFGSAFFEPFNTMRMTSYLNQELGIAVPQERAIDDFIRMPLSKAAAIVAKNTEVPDLDLAAPKGILERLHALYGPSNQRLAKLTGFDLSKYGYHLG
jgi:hypothetical protein